MAVAQLREHQLEDAVEIFVAARGLGQGPVALAHRAPVHAAEIRVVVLGVDGLPDLLEYLGAVLRVQDILR